MGMWMNSFLLDKMKYMEQSASLKGVKSLSMTRLLIVRLMVELEQSYSTTRMVNYLESLVVIMMMTPQFLLLGLAWMRGINSGTTILDPLRFCNSLIMAKHVTMTMSVQIISNAPRVTSVTMIMKLTGTVKVVMRMKAFVILMDCSCLGPNTVQKSVVTQSTSAIANCARRHYQEILLVPRHLNLIPASFVRMGSMKATGTYRSQCLATIFTAMMWKTFFGAMRLP
mmetsp:Transcript_13133/g.20267  ORF Transcript_13133/g.20267 Transcript_13133/m.20267 type:complete len:226 (-) Transcript_13133:1211-1888(-)